MNPHILFVIDAIFNPSKYTKEQAIANAKSAVAYKDAAEYAAAASKDIAYKNVQKFLSDANYLVSIYFKLSGESEKDYLDYLIKSGDIDGELVRKKGRKKQKKMGGSYQYGR